MNEGGENEEGRYSDTFGGDYMKKLYRNSCY